MADSSPLTIGNAEFLDELYRAYLEDPSRVDEAWRSYFASLDAEAPPSAGALSTARPTEYLAAHRTEPWRRSTETTQPPGPVRRVHGLLGKRALVSGDTWYFQVWHRETASSNFTNAVQVTVP